MESRERHRNWWEQRSVPVKIAMVLGFVVLGLAAFAGLSLIVMALWNALIPEIFGAKPINFWQAVGMQILSWILFKGHRGPHAFHEHRRRRHLREALRRADEEPV